ncbi:MAG TPA: CpsD/CapB family tyrosine-protein kinase [Acidobacteriota bacterium]|nr:CpsD/CapB family tyrosine-protein kinase [Acidobacteriota bacterium]
MADPKKNAPRSLLAGFATDAPYVTEVRRLMQGLLRRSRGHASRVYMITSAARGEGKSTTCALLAIVAARIFHRRTLLIDADMRRPTQHELLDVAQRPGLYEMLHGKAKLDEVRRPTQLPTLSVIPSGRPGRHVSDAYDDEGFARVLAEVRRDHELIFVDAAPVVPVVEPIMIAEHCDGLLLVAMAGRTPVPLIRRMRDILEPVRDKIVGGIVNNATEGLPYYYDYSYYGYRPDRVRAGRSGASPNGDAEPSGDDVEAEGAHPSPKE